jgi:hypothetical protein
LSFPANVTAQVGLHGPQAEEWLVAGTIAASQTAGVAVAATIQRQAASAAQSQQFCPVREIWHIERIYFVGTSAPTPDCQLVLLVDLVQQPYTPLASSVNLELLNRPASLSQTIIVPPGSVVSANIVNYAANSATTGVAITFKVQTMRYAQ